jgi:hypothetical protein
MIFKVHESSRSTSAGAGVPTIRALGGGRMVLNAAGQRLLGGCTHVQLLWDAETDRIGLKPSTANDPLAVRVTPSASQATITSTSFVKEHLAGPKTRLRLAWLDGILVASTVRPDDPLGKTFDA